MLELQERLFNKKESLVCLLHLEDWITGNVDGTVKLSKLKQRFDFVKREERLTKMMELIMIHLQSQLKCPNILLVAESRPDMEDIIQYIERKQQD